MTRGSQTPVKNEREKEVPRRENDLPTDATDSGFYDCDYNAFGGQTKV